MDEATSETDVFNELAHEFAERYRRGERPSLSEYERRHPGLAGEIRELFPALVMMEKLGSEDNPPSNSGTDPRRFEGPMPERLGDYRIIRELGRGGMGIVYEAVQESLGRHVALKVLCFDRKMERVQLIRFRREAKVAALLHHTNIVPVFFVGEDDGVHYYAMQYIRGQGLHLVLREVARRRRDAGESGRLPDVEAESKSVSLAARLLMGEPPTPASRPEPGTDLTAVAGRPGESHVTIASSTLDEGPSPDWPSSPSSILGASEAPYYRGVARVGIQVAEALAHAHHHGVVHRDIKPANLLLDLAGTVWVTDFGLARAEGSEELTNPGDVVGTLRYMAPERFRGVADPRGDVYSLGVTLYEMLTLKPAFEAYHRVQLIHTILHQEPPKPREHDRQIPGDLETIVLKAMAKNPADRFEDARAMASELRRFLDGRPIQSRRPSMAERLWRWSRRNPAVALLILLAATLTTVLAIGSTVAAWKFREQRNAVIVAQDKTKASLGRALTAEREGRAELGRSLLRQARAVRFSGQAGRRFEALQTLDDAARIAHEDGAPAEHAASLRDEVIAALALADDRPVQSWPISGQHPALTAYSVEADRSVEVEGARLLHVLRLSDRSEIQVLGSSRPASRFWPRFVPGGRFLLVSGLTSTELWDLHAGEVPAAWPADVRSVTSRSDGKQVAALRADGAVRILDLPTLSEAARCPVPPTTSGRITRAMMALSEDGRRLAVMQADTKAVRVYDLPSGTLAREIKVPSVRVDGAVALNRTGGLLAIVHDRAISVYDMADGERLSLLQGHQSEGIFAEFQPGGGLLASWCRDGTTRLWDPIRGHLLVTLRGSLRAWGRGGSFLAISRGPELIRHQIAQGIERRTIDCRLLGDSAGATLDGPARLSYSPDGRLIAMALRPDGVRIVRASDGQGLAHLPIGDCDEVLFLPDGALLTSNVWGLCRWPIRRLPGGSARLGPPEPWARTDQRAGLINAGLASSRDGRLVGILLRSRPGAMLIDPAHPGRRAWVAPRDWLHDLAISPDRRWVAAVTEREPTSLGVVKIWDVDRGKLVAGLAIGQGRAEFSPDGRWLCVGAEGRYRFFEAGSWTPGPEIGRTGDGGSFPLAFHPGGQIVATVDATTSKVRLVEVDTGAVLASLEVPDTSRTSYLTFSPDGRFLAAAKSDQRVDLWDLSPIRRRLEALHLASGLPDIFRSDRTPLAGPSVDRIEVEGTDMARFRFMVFWQILREFEVAARGWLDPGLVDAEELTTRGDRWSRLGAWQPAVADYRASLARDAEVGSTINNLAWLLVCEPGRGDIEEALGLARKAVAMTPESPSFRNTLGLALCRAGRFEEAVAVLESNVPRNPGSGYDWVALAICHQRLGRPDRARAALDNASRWIASVSRRGPVRAAGFRELFEEAESVVNEALPDLPSDVFAP